MKASARQTALAILVLTAGVIACVAFKAKIQLGQELKPLNPGPVVLAAGILLLGFAQGTLAAWTAGLVCGLVTLGFFMGEYISLDMALTGLAAQLVCTLFPLPWVEADEKAREAFDQQREPHRALRNAVGHPRRHRCLISKTFHRNFCTEMGSKANFLGRHIESRSSIYTVAIKQSHCRHL